MGVSSPADVEEAAVTARWVIPTVIRALMAAKRSTGPEVAAALSISPSSLYARLNGKSEISATEVAKLSVFFNVPVAFFYSPPKDLIRSRCFAESWAEIPVLAHAG
jgi:transcriptional regulator with XRE-family HTH domain